MENDKTQINMWMDTQTAQTIRIYAVMRGLTIGEVVTEMVAQCRLEQTVIDLRGEKTQSRE